MPASLVASGFGSDGGGLLRLTDAGFEFIDHLETTGIAVSPDGALLARALRGDPDLQTPGRLLLYDRSGVRWYRRDDELIDSHGIAWTGDDEFVHIATGTNEARWYLASNGDCVRRWARAGEMDASHLNCPAVLADGRVVTTAFGNFTNYSGWRPYVRAKEPTGEIIELGTGKTLVGGLRAPHDPVPLPDGGWLVCNSGLGQVLELAPDGTPRATIEAGGWTRGLAFDDARLYVGVSRPRHSVTDGRASVVAFDRATHTEVGRWSLPTEEIFALAWMTDALIAGARAGFGVPELDAAAPRQEAAWGIDEPLPAAALAVQISGVELPGSATRSGWISTPFQVRNDGTESLMSAGRLPIHVGARWLGSEGFAAEQGRAKLPHSVLPGETLAGRIHIPVPTVPGDYQLTIAALQETVAWCDAADPSRGVTSEITVF